MLCKRYAKNKYKQMMDSFAAYNINSLAVNLGSKVI